MRKMVLAIALTSKVFAQQPQAEILRSEPLHYDKATTRVVVAVKNVAPAELHNIWVKVQGGGSKSYRRKIPYLKSGDTRQVTVDAKTDEGPWNVEIESIDWLNQ